MLGTDPAAASRVSPSAIDLTPLDRVPRTVWEALSRKRVFFGHQSVGADIVAGLDEIAKRKPELGLRITESRDASGMDRPGIFHAKVGTNENCTSKLNDFASLMQGPVGKNVDIALVKLCYVDLTASGDPEALFDQYQRWVNELTTAHPHLRLVHATIPLTTIEADLKARIKGWLGRTNLGGHNHNHARQKYNNALRSRYGARVFDLARSEATLPDGRVARFARDGTECLALSAGYTNDGGHLNEAGRLAAARDLLLLLAEQCK